MSRRAYNSAGVRFMQIRGAKLALDMGISGPLKSISAYCFKHTPIQMPFSSYSNFIVFVEGKRREIISFTSQIIGE